MPNSATEKLLKILKHEVQMGYQDKAVTRGLASFTKAWLADAARANIDADWAQSVADDMRAYSEMGDATLRRAAMSALIHRLQVPQAGSAPSKGRAPQDPAAWNARPELPPAAASPRAAEPAPRRAPRAAPDRRPAPASAPASAAEEPERAQELPAPPPAKARDTRPANRAQPAPSDRLPEKAERPLAQVTARRYTGVGLDAPVTNITGIGTFYAERFAKLGVQTIRDLLYFFPTRYDDYSALKTINQLEYGEQVTIVGRVASALANSAPRPACTSCAWRSKTPRA